jgi:hypothetical protein
MVKALKAGKTVKIPTVEYRSLLAAQARLRAVNIALGIAINPGRGGVSAIDRDLELAEFIGERLFRCRVADIIIQCKEIFGSERTPSRSAIYRFWQRQTASKRVPKLHLKPPSNDL